MKKEFTWIPPKTQVNVGIKLADAQIKNIINEIVEEIYNSIEPENHESYFSDFCDECTNDFLYDIHYDFLYDIDEEEEYLFNMSDLGFYFSDSCADDIAYQIRKAFSDEVMKEYLKKYPLPEGWV